MATQKDKEQKLQQRDQAPNGKATKDTTTDATAGKGAHTYDPVGMAGKKAGVVEDVEEQLRQEGSATGQDAAARPGRGKAKA